MSTTIEAAAKTRLEQPDIPDSERAFCERTIVLSEGQRGLDAAGTFVEKAQAAKDLVDKGLSFLHEQLIRAHDQEIKLEPIYRRSNIALAGSENVTYIRQDIAPFVDPLFKLFPGLEVLWTASEARNVISYSGKGLQGYESGSTWHFPLADDPKDLRAQFNDGDSEELLLQRFATDTRTDILHAFDLAVNSLSRTPRSS